MKDNIPKSGFITDRNLILGLDLYQLTMGAAYYQYNLENSIEEKDDIAVFEYFVRRFPKNRNYLIFAGLEQLIFYLQKARFSEEIITYLRNKEIFQKIDSSFFDDYLPNFKFKIDVFSIKEGTFFFPNEPIIRVQGPIFHAQLVETFLLNVINFQIIIASKASRIKNISQNKTLLEFGTRRAHSPLAGIYAARASYIAGFDGTSNVIADFELGIRSVGTMAHSYVQKFEQEIESFKTYYDIYKENTVLLIDTYNIEKAAKKISIIGKDIKAVRIDSGDLINNSKKVRQILDKNGNNDILIVASSDLNEYKIKEILDNNAPIDAFGIGTELVTSKDDPTLSGVYKLIEYNKIPKIKISEEKIIIPGQKQVYRTYNNGMFIKDKISLKDEIPPENSTPLLIPIMKKGKLLYKIPKLSEVRDYCISNIEKLPKKYKKLNKIKFKEVEISDTLRLLLNSLIKEKKNE
ncbi:MAG: nicotinate phosphoribosyltransferase [Candidatus Lokiarchaeota archaeon]|nr:nicotinate phosphoribosyltransferase [Candidatus Lokiarchaeota archaeon]